MVVVAVVVVVVMVVVMVVVRAGGSLAQGGLEVGQGCDRGGHGPVQGGGRADPAYTAHIYRWGQTNFR